MKHDHTRPQPSRGVSPATATTKGTRMIHTDSLIEIVAVGRESQNEWVGMVYEVRAPQGWNFGSGTHAYREGGKAAALEMRRMLVRGGLERCDDDCDCND